MMKQSQNKRPLSGILLLNKSQGLSSNQALQKIKNLFSAKKAGHTGSLDPMATGMLPICFGEASKFSQYLLDADKIYFAEAKIGQATDTGDATGQVIAQDKTIDIPDGALEAACEQMLGDSKQIPPMYSALKYKGQPLYKLARQGLDVERQPRSINIRQIQLESKSTDTFSFTVRCSKGTYIRTLIEDIAANIGYHAHMTALHRIATAGFENMDMFEYDQLVEMTSEERDACLLPCDVAVSHFPAVHVEHDQLIKLMHGQQIDFNTSELNKIYRLYHCDQFYGLIKCQSQGQLAALRLMANNG